MPRCSRQRRSTPYEIVGAGPLCSAVWKHGDPLSGWRYRFNIYRMNPAGGSVSQLLRPGDVHDLVQLSHILALVLADDGCLPAPERRALADLAAQLDAITSNRPESSAGW